MDGQLAPDESSLATDSCFVQATAPGMPRLVEPRAWVCRGRWGPRVGFATRLGPEQVGVIQNS